MRARLHQKVSIFELVVGDVVCLKIGDQVLVDGLFLEGHSLKVEESSITQDENDHAEVNCHHLFLFSGAKVVDGYAKMLVTSVGKSTAWGEMRSSISHDTNEQTPLQVRLNKLTSSIRRVGLAIAFVALVVLLVRYFTGNTEDECVIEEFRGNKKKFFVMVKARRILATATTIVELVIPKGFSLAVKRTHIYSMKKMMVDQAKVRKLSAFETMGFATTIYTDIAGSLTLNQMKVTKFWLGKESFDAATYSSIAPYFLELVQEGVAMSTTRTAYMAHEFGTGIGNNSITMIVVGNNFGNVGFWDVDSEDDDRLYLYYPHVGTISGISMHQHYFEKIFTSCYLGFIRLMDAEKKIFDLGYGRLNIWDERVRKCSTQSKLHAHRINSIDFNSQNYNIMATSSSDGTAAIWDLRSIKVDQPRPLEEVGHDKAVQSAYFSPSGSSLITTRFSNNPVHIKESLSSQFT
uniref:P-type ATPase A domain-containing protein n=1 Tax=Quercus lobata TaxID=97700 RepID=A0A7N2LM19_QUELO